MCRDIAVCHCFSSYGNGIVKNSELTEACMGLISLSLFERSTQLFKNCVFELPVNLFWKSVIRDGRQFSNFPLLQFFQSC